MVNIPNPHKKVPMMFQAQIGGRCQLNYIPHSAGTISSIADHLYTPLVV